MQTANTSVINTMHLDFDVGTQLFKTAGPPMSGMPLWSKLRCFCYSGLQFNYSRYRLSSHGRREPTAGGWPVNSNSVKPATSTIKRIVLSFMHL